MLSIFDTNFTETGNLIARYGENMPSLIADYTVPPYFSEDLFQILGDQRPDYRWIIVGPERSGSTFHIDPNGTSAWNAVL
eukprot:Awhi_evm1s10495